MTHLKIFMKLIITCSILTFLIGCAVGRKHNFSTYEPEKGTDLGKGKILLILETSDMRPDILSGNEPPDWVGKQRSAVGIPFNITTKDGRSLAEITTEAIVKDLQSVDFSCVNEKIDTITPEEIKKAIEKNNAEKALHVVMTKFRSDTYTNIDVSWDLKATVYDSEGNAIATGTNKGEIELKGSAWNPVKAARTKVPSFYHKEIRKLVVENSDVISALTGE